MSKFLKGFVYAWRGIIACVRREQNMRVHLCIAFYLIVLMPFYGFSRAERAVVFICIGAVTAAEAFNTAIESVVDLVSPEKQFLAGLAKDCAAGAVLLAAVSSAAVGVMFYFDLDVIKKMCEWFLARPVMIVLFVISIAAWLMFICSASRDKNNTKL